MSSEFATFNSLAKTYCGVAGLEGHVAICNGIAQLGLYLIVAFGLFWFALFDFFFDFSFTHAFAVLHSVNVGE
ncbi:uncharacterized protein TrAtP1_005095 [Trichoderma atroviride]|uniref:uncharacterized protein n=1 Tax=Hypocrea atroviridis TaxID=63577 RepID=UPI00331922E2|nr:hypothetical protein TrAtP1_005095 [Trichoderma atroviride]